MAERLSYLPSRVTAGESIWISASNTTQSTDSDIDLSSDYLPADYNLKYQFAASTPMEVTGAANTGGTGWTLEITAAQTLLWSAGFLSYAGRVIHKSTGRVWTIDEGIIEVVSSPMTVSTYAAALTAIDSALAESAGSAFGSVNVPGGISFTYKSTDELLSLRAHFAALVSKTTAGKIRRTIRTEFT